MRHWKRSTCNKASYFDPMGLADISFPTPLNISKRLNI